MPSQVFFFSKNQHLKLKCYFALISSDQPTIQQPPSISKDQQQQPEMNGHHHHHHHEAVVVLNGNSTQHQDLDGAAKTPPSTNGIEETSLSNAVDPSQPDQDSIKMFVGQVPRSMDETELKVMFEEFGPVFQINVLRDKITGQSKGKKRDS